MRLFAALIIIIIIILIFAAAYLIMENINLDKSFDGLIEKKANELKAGVDEIKIQVSKDLSEKYKLDFTAFEKLAEDVKAERKRARDLEEENLRMKK